MIYMKDQTPRKEGNLTITATTPLTDLPHLVSISGTARLLGRGRNSVYKMIDKHQLDTVEVGDVQMVTRASIERLLTPHVDEG